MRYRVLIGFLLFCSYTSYSQSLGNLKVVVTGVRGTEGALLISLFNKADGFPSESTKAIKKEKIPIQPGALEVIFNDLPIGNYAIAILHDENNNLKMDTRLLVLPKEGYGFSNDASARFGPPSYTQAMFYFPTTTTIRIQVRY